MPTDIKPIPEYEYRICHKWKLFISFPYGQVDVKEYVFIVGQCRIQICQLCLVIEVGSRANKQMLTMPQLEYFITSIFGFFGNVFIAFCIISKKLIVVPIDIANVTRGL